MIEFVVFSCGCIGTKPDDKDMTYVFADCTNNPPDSPAYITLTVEEKQRLAAQPIIYGKDMSERDRARIRERCIRLECFVIAGHINLMPASDVRKKAWTPVTNDICARIFMELNLRSSEARKFRGAREALRDVIGVPPIVNRLDDRLVAVEKKSDDLDDRITGLNDRCEQSGTELL
jgi:hypothetical protein